MAKLNKIQLTRIEKNISEVINNKTCKFEENFKMPPKVTNKDIRAYARKYPKKTMEALLVLEENGRSYIKLIDLLTFLPQTIKLREKYCNALEARKIALGKYKSLLYSERARIMDDLIFNDTEIVEALKDFKDFTPKI